MKIFTALTMTAAAICLIVGSAAYADTATRYPEDDELVSALTFNELADFAVCGDEYLFLDVSDTGRRAVYYSEGEITSFDSDESIIAVDCVDGIFYYQTTAAVYTLDGDRADITLTGAAGAETLYPYYYNLTDGVLKITDLVNDSVTTADGSYTLLKRYDNKAFAVSGSVLYKFDGATATAVELSYADYSATACISAGNAAEALLSYTLAFADVREGAYMTEIDLETVGGYFNEDGSARTVRAAADTVALVLCYTGNAAIIAVNGQSYITLASALTERAFSYDAECGYDYATVTGSNIYASPFVAQASAVLKEASGTVVKVEHRLTYEGVLDYTFYEVSYTADGVQRTGYVAEGFLTGYIYAEGDPTEIADENSSEKNEIRTVLLVLAAVVLVLAAAGYLTYVMTSRKGKDRPESGEPPEESGQ